MGGFIAQAFAGVFATVFGLITNILGSLTGALLGVAVYIFNWVTSESFISLPYTKPGPAPIGNPFIEVGWTLTRDLTNIIFVLALVVIGLATILRLADYQAKKALPLLIIIALLINFSPVILGLIVDATNIMMRFFIQAGFESGNSFANYATRQWSNISALAGGLKFWDPTASGQAIAAAVGSLALIFFNVIAAIIYFLFAFLFTFRYVAIWTLVILSPLAFASYILPATRKFWSMWWNQFIQWSIIGVVAAFFLYLSDQFMKVATDPKFLTSLMAENPNAPGLSAIFNSLLPYGISLAFLFIGLMMALSTSAMGASTAISWAKKARGKAGELGKWAGKKAWKTARDRIPEGARKTMERIATGENPTWGKGKTGLGGVLQRSVAGAAGYTRRATGGLVRSAVIGTEQADAEKAKAKASKQDVISNLKDFRQTASVAERTAIMDAMRQKNQIKDALNPDVVGADNILKQNEVTSIYKKAHQMRNGDLTEGLERAFVNNEDVRKGFASITDSVTANAVDPNDRTQRGLDRKDREERGYTSFAEKVIGEVKTADEIKALQKYWWNNNDLMNAAHKFWGGSQTSQAATNFGRDFVNRLETTKKDASWYFGLEERKGSDGKVTHVPRNVAMPRYLASSAAQGLGIAPLESATTTTQANDMTRLANAWAPHFSKVPNQYHELQSILQDHGELEIMKRVPGTEQNQDVLRQRIQDRRNNLRNEITTLLAQYPELRTLLARTEEFFNKRKVGGQREQQQGGQQQGGPGRGPRQRKRGRR